MRAVCPAGVPRQGRRGSRQRARLAARRSPRARQGQGQRGRGLFYHRVDHGVRAGGPAKAQGHRPPRRGGGNGCRRARGRRAQCGPGGPQGVQRSRGLGGRRGRRLAEGGVQGPRARAPAPDRRGGGRLQGGRRGRPPQRASALRHGQPAGAGGPLRRGRRVVREGRRRRSRPRGGAHQRGACAGSLARPRRAGRRAVLPGRNGDRLRGRVAPRRVRHGARDGWQPRRGRRAVPPGDQVGSPRCRRARGPRQRAAGAGQARGGCQGVQGRD